MNAVDVEERRLNELSSDVKRLLSECSNEIPEEGTFFVFLRFAPY